MASRKVRSYPRTNSLAFSKVDCHTCQQLEQTCDRQRPRCRTCLRAKRSCGGYVMNLKWKGHSFPSNRHAPEDSHQSSPVARDEPQASKSHDQSFRFVTINSKRRRRNTPHNGAFKDLTTTFDVSDTSNQKQRRRPAIAPKSARVASSRLSNLSPEYELCSSESDGEDESSIDQGLELNDCQTLNESWPSWSNTNSIDEFSDINSSSVNNSDMDSVDEVIDNGFFANPTNACQAMVLTNRATSPIPNELTLPRVLFNNHTHQWGAVLDLYNEEFCILPLTQDCSSNPFRIQKDSCEGSAFLLHAVLALASQHIAKKDPSTSLLAETLDHQATALTLFRQSLTYTSPFTLLDTILLLVNFEATQTASSTWSIHLNAALRILNSIGISQACQRSSRTRAQIAMLIWWDVTLAFIARKDLIFPLHYLETLMQHGTEDGWTYFALNGCPADLVMFMARLCKLAAIYDKAEQLGCFSDAPVQQLIDEVQSWKNPEDVTLSDISQVDIDPNSRRNRFHCIEAWRHTILLYAYRVFTKKQSVQRIRSITHLARVILDHVRCIPDTENVQKQTLLPVFLAAAEVEDTPTRAWVRSYCNHWAVTARYDMFSTASALLDIIWADWLPQTRDVYWWGSKVGFTSVEGGDEYLFSEILLG